MSHSFTRPPATKTTTTLDEKPKCLCGKAAVRLVSRSEKNPDRPYWSCGKQYGDPKKCTYFKWESDLLPPSASFSSSPASRTLSAISATHPAPLPQGSYTLSSTPVPSTPPKKPIDPAGSAARRAAILTAMGSLTEDDESWSATPGKGKGKRKEVVEDEIDEGMDDWAHVNLDEIEEHAISASQEKMRSKGEEEKPRLSVLEKLEAAQSEEQRRGVKRKRGESTEGSGEEGLVTPGKKGVWEEIQANKDHPHHAIQASLFPLTPLTTPSKPQPTALPISPIPASPSSATDLLSALSAHINQQDATIRSLQQKLTGRDRQIEALREREKVKEGRVRELEALLNARRG